MSVDAHIESLERKHQALEEQLVSLHSSPSTSSERLADVKRQKLTLKDEIERLRSVSA